MRGTITTVKGNTYFLNKLIKISSVTKNDDGEYSFNLLFQEREEIEIFIKPSELFDEDKFELYSINKDNIDNEIKKRLIEIRKSLLDEFIKDDYYIEISIEDIAKNLKKYSLEIINKYVYENE